MAHAPPAPAASLAAAPLSPAPATPLAAAPSFPAPSRLFASQRAMRAFFTFTISGGTCRARPADDSAWPNEDAPDTRAPFSQRLPVTKTRSSPRPYPSAAGREKRDTMSLQRFAHASQLWLRRTMRNAASSCGPSRPERACPTPSGSASHATACASRASKAAPHAPISSGRSGRATSTPHSSSKARSSASLAKAPPCTITRVSAFGKPGRRTTLNKAFLAHAHTTPAAMSARETPSFCACFTRDSMKVVQRQPRSTGRAANSASLENASFVQRMDRAMASKSEPQPELHASFKTMSSIWPSRT